MKRRRSMMGVIGFFVTAAMLQAQAVPGRWQKLDSQEQGVQIIVEMKDGESIRGAYKGSTPEALNVLEIGGKERMLRKADVRKVVSAEKRSGPLWNGALIGFVCGFVPVVAIAAGADRQLSGPAVGAGILVGGIGAGIGLGIDAANRGHETLYKAR